MKFSIWGGYVALVLLTIQISLLECTTLKPCGHDNSTSKVGHGDFNKWFKWARFYSFCMYKFVKVKRARKGANSIITFSRKPTTPVSKKFHSSDLGWW